MMRSLYSGVSGLRAHQEKMDVVSNNIANVNTVGYKKSTVTFQDMLSQTLRAASGPNENETRGGINPSQIGLGVTVGAITTVHSQGAPTSTGNATDLMIVGEGYFILGNEENEERYYTRAGAFVFDKEGYLVNSANGMYVLDDSGESRIQIEDDEIENIKNIAITKDGYITYINADGEPVSGDDAPGPIGIAKFANPSGLVKVGENLYISSDNSGNEDDDGYSVNSPGENGAGTIMSNALEMSNVDIAQEFTDMIITQRGYQANARTIRVADEILQELVNIKR